MSEKKKGYVSRRAIITRALVQSNRDTYYVFGDNMARRGYGGQAAAMRGEPNAIGIPTKWTPNTNPSAYFRDSDLADSRVMKAIDSSIKFIQDRLDEGYNVVIPESGIGTGLSQLDTRAPMIFNKLKLAIEDIEKCYKQTEDEEPEVDRFGNWRGKIGEVSDEGIQNIISHMPTHDHPEVSGPVVIELLEEVLRLRSNIRGLYGICDIAAD